jgi:outer membrane protein assembly factor BamB
MNFTARHGLFLALLAGSVGFSSMAAEWSQYRGPSQNGSSPEKILLNWPDGHLREIWKAPLKDGFSAITVGGGKAFTLVTREVEGAPQEVCVALDAGSGKEVWATPLGVAKYDDGGNRGTKENGGGDGPRSTPSYDDGKVYTYSSRMVLKCMDAGTGAQVWSSDIIADHAGHNIHWESAASPLVEDGLVYVAGGGAGQSLLAFDKKDGHVVWSGQDEKMTHSTPTAVTILGQRQIIFLTQSGLVSLEPKTGNLLWRYHFPYSVSTAISPVVSGEMVYCSAAYNVGASACAVAKGADGWTATQLWFNKELPNHWSTPVCSDGYLYGIYGQAKFGSAPLKCVELATGKVLWAHDGFGPGGCTLVNGHVLVLNDAGDLVLVKATPTAYTEVSRSHVLAGKCWNAPTISNGRIYARSTKEGVCLDASASDAR